MSMYYKLRDSGRWFRFSLLEQMSNIGSDVERAIQWKREGNVEYGKNALDRVLELVDLTVADSKNRKRLKEILRFREMFIDYFLYDNTYNFSDQFWRNYFYYFNYAALAQRNK